MGIIIASTYEIIKEIGSGGGGIVYLAKHLRLNKKVVLKADKRKITTRAEVLRREVDALKDLSHTYIPQVYDFFVENETVYTVIDFVEGESMDKPLKRGEKFSQEQVIKWACQLLEALSYLHNPIHGNPPRGIVHSDIKPANIMLTPQGDIKLIDFNIALALGEENIVGLSFGYASPEQYGFDFSNNSYKEKKESVFQEDAETELMSDLSNKKQIKKSQAKSDINFSQGSSSAKKIIVPDARSDIYSLGATLYHFLSGNRPDKNAVDVIPLSEKDFSIPIIKIISKAMNPNPDLRYQSAEEMLYDFKHIRELDPRTIKRRKMLITFSVFFSVMLFCEVFVSFVGLKRMEAEQKSYTLAGLSEEALNSGNAEMAVKYALDAIPIKKNIFAPKAIAKAKKALTDAEGIYDLSDGYKLHKTVSLSAESFKLALSPNGEKGVAICAFEAVIFDTDSGNIIATLPIYKSALSDAIFIDNNTLIYAGENGLSAYDIENGKTIWTGKPATGISVSNDKKSIAVICRDESKAILYDTNGQEKKVIDFNGKKQRVVNHDVFSDPRDNILSLNNDGSLLAVSFDDGSVAIYNTKNGDKYINALDKSDYIHMEGGFNGKYFAFSATNSNSSEFHIFDTENDKYTVNFTLDSKIGVKANENAIYIYNLSTIVRINPETGEQKEMAYTDSDITAFACNLKNTVVITKKKEYLFYDEDADLIDRYSSGQENLNFADIKGKYAILASSDTNEVKILKKKEFSDYNICSYDNDYFHDEARISDDGKRLLLFSYKGFRLYETNGNLIKEVEMPNPKKIYDQQYSRKSGNLAVIYDDAFRLYSGTTGELIYEAENLKSVLYSSYGVHILGNDNCFKLIDIDTGKELIKENVKGDFGAYCGFIVDRDFLGKGKMTGAGKTKQGYFFTVSTGDICSVYDEKGKKRFELEMQEQNESFFTDTEVIISPLHGTPVVYSLESGKKVADLEKDAYVTYITQLDNYVMSEYVSAQGEHYGILLDKNTYEPLAYLPKLTDISNGKLIFDYHKGTLRETELYSLEELIQIGNEICNKK